jgi:acetylornithine deacetylase
MTSPSPIAFLQELIRLGREGEAAVQARVADALAAIGCSVETVEYDPAAVTLKDEFATGQTLQPGQRRAVIGRLAGSGDGRSLILFAHPDGEPHGDLSRWSVDPFAGVIRDGRITGFGVADDLSGVAAMISGLALAQADGWRPAGDIIIASTPSKRHARGVAALLARMAPPDVALYLHPAESGMGMAEVKACTPGLLEFRISFAGKAPETVEPGQTAFAHRSVSAATVQAALLAALAQLDAARGARIRHERIAGFVGRATNLHVSHATLGVTGKRNTIAVSGVIEGAVSMPPGERLADVQAEIAAAVEAVFQRAPFDALPKPEITFLAGVAGAEVPADHPLFRAADDAITAVVGKPAFVNPVHTASDIRVPILQAGIPCIGLGPLGGNLTQNGFADEWVDAADHERCVAVVANILKAWCG